MSVDGDRAVRPNKLGSLAKFLSSDKSAVDWDSRRYPRGRSSARQPVHERFRPGISRIEAESSLSGGESFLGPAQVL
jgi:hypothetical protein